MQPTISINDAFTSALKFHQSGQLEKAASIYHQILSSEPQHQQSLHHLGVIAQQLSKHDEAEILYIKALASDPNNAQIQNDLGLIYLNKKHYVQAHRCFRKAIEVDPKFANAYLNLGNTFFDEGDVERAIPMFKKALKHFPHNLNILFNLALSYSALSQFDKAKITYKIIIDKNGTHAQSYVNLSTIYYLEDNLDEAEEYLKTAIQYDSSLIQPHLNLGLVYFKQNKPEKGEQHLAGFAKALENAQRLDQAINVYSALIQNAKNNAKYHYSIGTIYLNTNHLDEAVSHLLKACKKDSTLFQAYNNLGLAYKYLGEIGLAEKAFHDAINSNANNSLIYNNLGNLYSDRHEVDNALKYYQLAINKNPNVDYFHTNLGNELQKYNKFEQAAECYSKAIDISPDYAEAYVNLAHLQLGSGQLKDGWLGQEWRIALSANTSYLRDPRSSNRILPKPSSFSPIDPKGKSILLICEQKVADILFSLRFVNIAINMGARVELLLPSELTDLISRNTNVTIVTEKDIHKHYDYVFSLLELPLVLGIDTLDKIPPPLALSPDKYYIDKVKQQFLTNSIQEPLIVASWQTESKSDYVDEIALSPFELGKAIREWSGSVIILQANGDLESIAAFNQGLGRPTINYSDICSNLEYVLALISQADVVVSTNSINLHLCAGLEKPANVLLPSVAEWWWMLEGDFSPWFPKFQLYRQSIDKTWSSSLKHLTTNLL